MSRVAILVPTHNRAASLRRTLSALVAQTSSGPSPELIVVDNNSDDETAAVCAAFGPAVRRVFEPRQGLSHARNAGIATVAHLDRDDVIAFIDDDIEPGPGWLESLMKTFDRHPEVDCVGGRVLPSNPAALPRWITRAHWGPLALQDHGPEPRRFDARTPIGLVGANLAFRKRVFDEIGLFSPKVQRVKEGIGSTEDHEFLARVYAGGRQALYAPDIVVVTEVPAERMTRAYHRRWHRGHGRFLAVMQEEALERSRGRLFGVPLHLFRTALTDALGWLRSVLTGDSARAFAAETRLWFFSGFLRERCTCLARR